MRQGDICLFFRLAAKKGKFQLPSAAELPNKLSEIFLKKNFWGK